MSTMPDPSKKGQPDPHTIQKNEEEFAHVRFQDHLVTSAMGGPFPEQPDPTIFHRILDVGCGAGGWAVEAAEMYPTLSLVGIDIHRGLIDSARVYAEAHHVADRVEFKVMDALLILEFPNNYFDLVNVRCSSSFLRTWDWPKLFSEMLRVTRAGGVVRITEEEVVHESNSPAFAKINEMKLCAYYRSGHLFTQETTGLTAHLSRLLTQHGCQKVQTKPYKLEFRAGTSEGDAYRENIAYATRRLLPLLQKWGCAADDYEAIRHQALEDMQQCDFYSLWTLHCVWGTKLSSKARKPQQEH